MRNPLGLELSWQTHDKAGIIAAVIGDCNLDGDTDDPFESGTIYADTTSVKLTGAITKASGHPIESIMVEYQDANGVWQKIGEAMGSEFEIDWDVAGMDVSAGGTVLVRAVATNAFGISDPDPMPFSINLDPGICPLDPDVVAITVDTPTAMNPDSGGPQGTLTLNAYTPSRTYPAISSVRLAAKGPQDAEWPIESSEAVEHVDGQELADILGDLVSTVGPDKPVVQVNSTYQKWVVSIDTTALADTITAESPAARDCL